MPLSISAGSLALSPSLTTYFLGVGGTAPYVYSVLAGGAGGTINPITGFYTAPSVTGSDSIQVTDAASGIQTVDILIGTPLELFCDVIQRKMNLGQGQVYLFDQKINIPTDSRLYVAVGVTSCKPFGNSNRLNASGFEDQSANFYSTLDINILSRGPEARDRKEEVILALNSIYSQQQQEQNGFYIGKISTSFVNLSEIDGSAIPYRFVISVALQ